MSNFYPLAFAVACGVLVGTIPGVREKMPWSDDKARELEIASRAATPAVAPITPTPRTPAGSWMQERGRTALDQHGTPAAKPRSSASGENHESLEAQINRARAAAGLKTSP